MALLDAFTYPPVGFHFSVVIEMFPQTPQDFRFQSVSGLSVDLPTETVAEGGELRFKYHLPGVPQFGKLTLKRGLFQGSFVVNWCKNAIERFEFEPKNVLVTLLNDLHLPVAIWHVHNAYPTRWAVSEFNAEQSSVVVETLELTYQYFQTMGLDVSLTGGLGAVASVAGSVSI